jgi:DNA polymerase (family X)
VARANDDVEAALAEYADLVSILSDDAFKARAYEKAARAVGGYAADIQGFDVSALQAIPNVGKSIAVKIEEYLVTGTIAALEELRARVPAGVRDMMAIPGVGPKKAMVLYQELGLSSPDELAAAVQQGALAGVKGFGKRTEENILRGLERLQSSGGRVQIGPAMDLAETLLASLTDVNGVRRTAYAGSLRRMAETVADIDLLVASNAPTAVMDAFTALAAGGTVLARGETKSSIVSAKGLQVDLRVIAPEVWGAAMIYFTGSKAHNIRIREIAVRRQLKLSEYGLFEAKTGDLIVAETEEEVYGRLGLPWIPPTLREDRGEVEAAAAGELPRLVELRDIKGDLHTHTNLTDGLASLEEMIATARGRRYAYYAVTDHAPELYMQRMTADKMLAQRARLRRLAGRESFELLHGTELNIGPDGALDWDDEFLAGFDLCVASIHSHFNMSRDEMTRRLVRAIENPYVNIIGHPTTRRIGSRPPIDFDEEAVFAAAARTGTALEVNSHVDRLDLNDERILWARRLGAVFAVDTDAHAVGHLELMRFGVGTAQRGWLDRKDVINTWPPAKLRRFLRAARPAQ